MNSIRRSLTSGLVAILCLLWIAGGTALYLIIRNGLVAEFDRALKATAEGLASAAEQVANDVDVDLDQAAMPGFARHRLPDYFEIRWADGRVLKRSASLGARALPPRPPVSPSKICWDLTLPDGRAGRAFSMQFTPHADKDSPPLHPAQFSLTVVVARHRLTLDRRLGLIATTLLSVGLLLIVGTVGLMPVVVRRGLATLADLGERSAAIDARSLGRRFPTEALPAELVPIVQRLNDLLARLEQSFERERQFTADAAHELRTPLAELRSLAEVSLQWPDDPAATARAFQEVRDTVLRMNRIVTDLLVLARCDSGRQPTTRVNVALSEAVNAAWARFAKRAADRELRVACEVSTELGTQTDPELFGLILTNLLGNAVEYTPEGGALDIRAARSADRFHLRVANTTDNLTPADLPHLFERFWRKDAAHTSAVHSGLGLSLAKAAADVLGYTLQAELAAGPTLVFTLSGSASAGACHVD